MKYPKVLIVAMGRINAVDTANNGLLLRNLFGGWPRENMAQIYSSGDNGDEGFFGCYYQMGPQDRRFGNTFYRLKSEVQNAQVTNPPAANTVRIQLGKKNAIKSYLNQMIVGTGLYELIFRPCLSAGMLAWVKEFQPDIIFAQGYCLTFALLPVMLKRHFELPAAYYPTDDWPSDAYRADNCYVPLIPLFMNRVVSKAAYNLVKISTVCLAFNQYMQDEYSQRYGKKFSVLMHGDELSRFQNAQPMRLIDPDETWIVSTGYFNEQRWSLLCDLDEACEILSVKGHRVRVTVFPVNQLAEMTPQANNFKYIHFEHCPSHDGLASVLRSADILFLPERFGENSKGIRLSVSSKAHLFMFSGQPTVVYSDLVTGIARYAEEDGWAAVVGQRDPRQLALVLEKLIVNNNYRQSIITCAQKTAIKNHQLSTIQQAFSDLMISALNSSQ
ncbi:MAG: hypothetical protein HXX11_21260 [Desulfuromonadales bacterium]|nr:hypothetical protein [Desulfuromonadales bacterium]